MELPPPPASSSSSSTRRWPLVVAGVLLGLVVVGVAVAALTRAESSKAKTREEAHLAYPGSTLVEEQWQDEEHVRYIDTGGYDERAGWEIEYSLGQPASFVEVCDHFESVLEDRGWQLASRDDDEEGSGSYPPECSFTRGDGDDPTRFRVVVDLGAYDSLTDFIVRAYTVEYRLPYQVEPSYDG